MKVIYEAFDGCKFDDQWQCEDYENAQLHLGLSTIDFYTSNNNKFLITYDNLTSENIYNNCEKVHIHNEEELKDFLWLAEYTGWCEWNQINSPGFWVRHQDSLCNGIWLKEGEDIPMMSWMPLLAQNYPPDDEEVIITVYDDSGDSPSYDTYTGWHFNGVWIVNNERICGRVVAWMPLPKPYIEPQK